MCEEEGMTPPMFEEEEGVEGLLCETPTCSLQDQR